MWAKKARVRIQELRNKKPVQANCPRSIHTRTAFLFLERSRQPLKESDRVTRRDRNNEAKAMECIV
jgi:hypothetical protein